MHDIRMQVLNDLDIDKFICDRWQGGIVSLYVIHLFMRTVSMNDSYGIRASVKRREVREIKRYCSAAALYIPKILAKESPLNGCTRIWMADRCIVRPNSALGYGFGVAWFKWELEALTFGRFCQARLT